MKNNLAEKDFYNWGKWVSPVMEIDLWSNWLDYNYFEKFFDFKPEPLLVIDNGSYYVGKEIVERIKMAGNNLAEEGGGDFSDDFFSRAKVIMDELIKFKDNYEKGEKMTRENLEYFFEKLRELRFFWAASFFVPWALEEKLNIEIGKLGLSQEDIFDFIELPEELDINIYNNKIKALYKRFEEYKLLKLAEEKSEEELKIYLEKNNPEILKDLNFHLKNFGWMGTHHFWGEPLTFGKIIEDILLVDPNNFIENKKEKNNLPIEISNILKVVGLFMYLRTRCAEVNAIVTFVLRPELIKTGEKVGLKYDEMIWFTFDEVAGAIQKGEKLDGGTYFSRRKNYIIVKDGGEKSILENDACEEFRRNFYAEKDNAIAKEIRGSIGCKGKAVGKVRIFFEPSNIREFEKGEILVVPETTPDFVPVMKLAGAIVTEVGGITSHAAIVSRELKIPCIIGTKIATQVLKDGDLVEVDADNGIIKIIK